MTEPYSECVSPLGLAALQAQSGKLPSVDPNTSLSHCAFCQEYLLPLARTDLLYDDVHVHSRVVDISRLRCQGFQDQDLQERANDEFRLVIESKSRGPWIARADIVLDCSGLENDKLRLGPGRGIAIGESDLGEASFRCYREWKLKAGEQPKRALLVFGSNKVTCDTVRSILNSVTPDSPFKLIWGIPVTQPLEAAQDLAQLKGALQNSGHGYFVETLGVESIGRTAELQLVIRFSQPDDTTLNIVCDEVLACESSIPIWDFCATLLVNSPHYTRQDSIVTKDRALSTFAGWQYATGEPNYYVLGSKRHLSRTISYAETRRSQIRDVFALLGARQDLDLYRSIQFAN